MGADSRALVRLACLSRAFNAPGGEEVTEAFNALSSSDRAEVVKHLNADGVNQKGFVIYNSPLLLNNARQNAKVGLVLALQMLLNVYRMAAKEFQSSSEQVVTIMVDELAEFAKVC